MADQKEQPKPQPKQDGGHKVASYRVEPLKAVRTRNGMRTEGSIVTESDFYGGRDTLKRLATKGVVILAK